MRSAVSARTFLLLITESPYILLVFVLLFFIQFGSAPAQRFIDYFISVNENAIITIIGSSLGWAWLNEGLKLQLNNYCDFVHGGWPRLAPFVLVIVYQWKWPINKAFQ